jgi:multiple sugar transport system ATP-binding protein
MGERIAVMSEARLQQVGTPQELYDHPDNRFVAGFIGSPSMNFLEVSVGRDGDGVTLRGDGVEIPLPSRYRTALAGHTGERLIVGVRPEHLDVRSEGPSGTLTGKADVVEYLGNEELIHVGVGMNDVVALIDSSNRLRPGDDLTLKIELDKVHLFDPDTTLALDKEGDPTVERASRTAIAALEEERAPQVTTAV